MNEKMAVRSMATHGSRRAKPRFVLPMATRTVVLLACCRACSALSISRALPVDLPAAAAFLTEACWGTWEGGVVGQGLTRGQRLLLEQQSLSQLKERFREVGRYDAPVLDRMLPSTLLLAREETGGELIGCAGVEGSVVDLTRRLVLRRSAGEKLLRERLPRKPPDGISGVCDPASKYRTGRAYFRESTAEEAAAELELLRAQRPPEEADPALASELLSAAGLLPGRYQLRPVLCCVAVAVSERRSRVATELCRAVEAEVARWGQPCVGGAGDVLALVDEDSESAAAFLASLGYSRVCFRDTGSSSLRPERPSPVFDRRELELIHVPMPLLALEKGRGA